MKQVSIQLVMLMLFSISGCINNKDITTETSHINRNNYQFNTKEIHGNNDGKNIYGIAYIPVDAGEKVPTVIYSHGYGGTNSSGRIYAETLAKKGIAVYCFDFCGGSTQSRSDGETTEMSVFTEKSDLEAVIEMIKGLDFVDNNNLFLLGSSQGGMVSAMTAAGQPNAIRGLILLYPAFVISDSTRQLYQSIDEIPDVIQLMWMQIGRRYYEDIWNYDVYEHIGAYNQDVLIIHGDRDELVPVSFSERAVEVYPSAELKVIAGAGHGFQGNDAETAIGYMLDYIGSKIN